MHPKIDWSRCVHIDGPIDNDLIAAITPKILQLRQENSSPITLALNSPGGLVALLPSIRELVRHPDQDGNTCSLITVATHRAFSAAGMLLATGDIAVALPRAQILFHDVRYGNVKDVTPGSALKAAESLEASNDRASKEIADHMFRRWMWMYLDVDEQIPGLRSEFPLEEERFESAVRMMQIPKSEYVELDLVGLMIFIFKHLRPANEKILFNAVDRLTRWGAIGILNNRPRYRQKGSRALGTLDSLAAIFRELHGKSGEPLGGTSNDEDLSIFMVALASSLKGSGAREAIHSATRDMVLFSAMNDMRHWNTAFRVMLRHKNTFFPFEKASNWDELTQDERTKISAAALPIVRVIWLLCVQVARELFSGEHRLNPREAMVLGLIDDALGETVFETVRAFEIKSAAKAAAAAADQGEVKNP